MKKCHWIWFTQILCSIDNRVKSEVHYAIMDKAKTKDYEMYYKDWGRGLMITLIPTYTDDSDCCHNHEEGVKEV